MHTKLRTWFVTALITGLGMVCTAGTTFAAAVEHERFRLQPNDPGGDDEFGSNVAIDGDTLVVGAANSGNGLGAAYVFRRRASGWEQQAKVAAGGHVFDSEFGETVGISGDTMVVGAPSDVTAASRTGAAYVFKREGDNWTPQAVLVANDAADEDFFAGSLAIGGDVIVVGAESANDSAGAAYVYRRVGGEWRLETKLVASDAQANAFFGSSVAISGTRIVVGAASATVNGRSTGAAYVFERGEQTWIERAKLNADDASFGSGFGSGVGISGNTIVVGAFMQDTAAGPQTGAAYVFQRADSGWVQDAKLAASDGVAGRLFGVQLGISANAIAIGASAFALQPNQGGSAYVYTRQGNAWVETKKLLPSDGAANDGFGAYIAIDADTVLVGAELSRNVGASEGAAYLFDVRALDQ